MKRTLSPRKSSALPEIRALIKLMKKEGVLQMKHGEIEIAMSPLAIYRDSQLESAGTEPQGSPGGDRPFSEEETLFWSTQDSSEGPTN